jgi:iron complex transport system ATP-binding protein
VAYLPQQLPQAEGMTVRELVAIGRYPWHGALGRFGVADREKVEEAIALVGLKPLAHRLVDSLSGGERQRAWIAMLVAQDSRCCCSMNRPRRWISPIRSMSWRWCIA